MKLSAEQEKEVLEHLKQRRPEIYNEVIALKESDPARYRRTIKSIYPFVARMRKMSPEVAEAYETLQKTHVNLWKLARELSAVDSPERQKEIESAMRDEAAKQFEAEQMVRRQRLDELKQQIANLQNELDQRAKDSNSVIQETVDRFKRSAARYGKGRPHSTGTKAGHSGKKSDKSDKKSGKKKAAKSSEKGDD